MSALNIKKGSTSHSAYDLRDSHAEGIVSHTLAVIVENEPGVLARVIGLFSARGYNIDSLTVAEVDHTGHRSRITIVTSGTPHVINQVEAQLSRLVSVYAVHDLTAEGPSVQRELALFKVAGKGEHRIEALRLADRIAIMIDTKGPEVREFGAGKWLSPLRASAGIPSCRA